MSKPEWTAVMTPLSESELWPKLRSAAVDMIERDRGPDSQDGIGSSDINHTIFGVASFLVKNGYSMADFAVLIALETW